jgi:hypothetical protein
MSADPLVAHFANESHRTRRAWGVAGACQLWIWLNAAAALAFRFWVVDRFDFSAFVEEKLWPGLFLIESLIQLFVTLAVCTGLFRMRRGRDFWVFSAAVAFSMLVDSIIMIAWAFVIFPEEYRLAATFGLFGSYLMIPAILFALYCALVMPRPISLWIYAVTLTIALKCAAIILITVPGQAFVSYLVIILLALASVILPLRFGFANPISSDEESVSDEP